jgi:hypothetical protein
LLVESDLLHKGHIEEQSNLLQLLQNILNKDDELDELKQGVKGLKSGKAAGEDGILNEFLENSGSSTLLVIRKVVQEASLPSSRRSGKSGYYLQRLANKALINLFGNQKPRMCNSVIASQNLGE